MGGGSSPILYPCERKQQKLNKHVIEEQESGDGTNLCVSFGGELLQRAEELLKEGIHANDVYKGYELARDKAAVL